MSKSIVYYDADLDMIYIVHNKKSGPPRIEYAKGEASFMMSCLFLNVGANVKLGEF